MTRVVQRLLCIASVAPLLVVTSLAMAQISPFKDAASSGFTDEDFDMLQAAEARLYKSGSSEIGKTTSWANPNTGNRGMVELKEAYTWHDLPCKKLLNTIILKKKSDQSEYTRSWCEVKPGEWKVRY